MHTQTHARTHAHHLTDVEPPSAPAAPCLASPSLPLLTYSSVYAVTLTPNYNLNLPPLLPGTVSRLAPWFSEGVPVQSAWRACRCQRRRWLGPGPTGTWALGRLVLHHTGPSAQGETLTK